MSKFKYIVSLGYFCSPAMEFKRINRRPFSLPFDWLITPKLSDVINLINNNFEDFLYEEYFYQLLEHPQYYRNIKYNIDFYHDFSPFVSFDSQINDVTVKYNRRISRFYDIIRKPTLFLRYLSKEDFEYIVDNYELIVESIKKFNSDNDIIFVANDEHIRNLPPNISIYYVKKDFKDSVSRKFLKKNDALLQYISNNVETVTAPKKSKHFGIIHKIYQKIRIKLNLVYHHKNQCHI